MGGIRRMFGMILHHPKSAEGTKYPQPRVKQGALWAGTLGLDYDWELLALKGRFTPSLQDSGNLNATPTQHSTTLHAGLRVRRRSATTIPSAVRHEVPAAQGAAKRNPGLRTRKILLAPKEPAPDLIGGRCTPSFQDCGNLNATPTQHSTSFHAGLRVLRRSATTYRTVTHNECQKEVSRSAPQTPHVWRYRYYKYQAILTNQMR